MSTTSLAARAAGADARVYEPTPKRRRKPAPEPLTAERLRELLAYNPETGTFRWKVSVGTVKAGKVAGNVSSRGYVTIAIDGRRHYAHRLVWL